MTEPKTLSPHAQAVMNAYKEARDGKYIGGEWIQDEAGQVAAALRAAAGQLTSAKAADRLRAIAAELEGAS